MAKAWTESQNKAITAHGQSLLVSAAAGSGKTAVLVERIIQMITDETQPMDIDQLLVVTFTNAAATEMKERIGLAINQQLRQNPHSEHLYQQSILLNKAQITTLHAFCLDLVRTHFYQLDIAPNVKIADDIECQLLKNAVLEDLLEDYYSLAEPSDFLSLVDRYGGREDEGVSRLILRLYDQAMSVPQPELWLSKLSRVLLETPWVALYLPQAADELQGIHQGLQSAVRLCQGDEGLTPYLANLLAEQSFFEQLLASVPKGWDALMVLIRDSADPFGRMPRLKKDTYDDAEKEQVTTWRNGAKARFRKLRSTCQRSEQALLNDMTQQAPMVALLAQLTLDFGERYRAKKAEKDLIDFDDMEHDCLKLLYEADATGQWHVSPLCLQLKDQYQEILVDEYQDINDLQESIIQAVSRPDNLFMVGDVKQSIYGFRMANPQLFLEKYHTYPLNPSPQETRHDPTSKRRIDLNSNFRCRQNIIDGVNTLFSQLMRGEKGDLLYDTNASLIMGAAYPPADGQNILDDTIELYVIDKKETSDHEDDTADTPEVGEDWTTMALEGQLIGQKIQQLLAEQRVVLDKDSGEYRQLTYRDIVILLRSPKSAGQALCEQLNQFSIPVTNDSGDGYFSAWEIQIVLALLHILDNPLQDIPLVAVLRAPFFAFSDEELLQLRVENTREPYFYGLRDLCARETESPLAHKTADFLAKLTAWRTMARQKDLSSLLWQLYQETGFYDYVGALTGGAQRQGNLRALHEKSRQYEETSLKGLFNFLRFIEQMQNNAQDLEPAKLLGDNENVVRIMSIHKSKGLEFPVVFLANMGKKFNMMDVNQEIVLDKDLGIGLPVVQSGNNLKYPTVCQWVIKHKLRQATLTEEKRVLYVALTRAREKLYLIGSGQPKIATVAQSYLDWLIPLVSAPSEHPAVTPDYASRWQMTVLAADSLSTSQVQSGEEAADLARIRALEPLVTSGAYTAAINQRLSWQYPDRLLSSVKSKATVTEIKGHFADQPPAAMSASVSYGFSRRPRALQQNHQLSAAEKGTMIHLVMRHVDLQAPIDQSTLTELVHRLEVQAFIPSGQGQALSLTAIQRFFQSPLGQRLCQASPENVQRELPFTIAIPCAVLDPQLIAYDRRPILVQGMIDCAWLEEDGWVLVDYKSDRVNASDLSDFVQQYAGQVRLYSQALEQIWHQPVKEKYLYLFALNQFVPIP